MSANTIQAKYDELENIAQRFGQWAESNAEISSRLQHNVEQLKHGDWIGKGSEAFFKEMDDEVLPAVGRLIHALQQSQSTINEIIFIIQSAEEEAARPFTRETLDLSQTSSTAGTIRQMIEDVARQVVGGSQPSSPAGTIRQMIEDVARQVAEESQPSSANTIKQMIEDVARQVTGGSQPSSPAGTIRQMIEDVARQVAGESQSS